MLCLVSIVVFIGLHVDISVVYRFFVLVYSRLYAHLGPTSWPLLYIYLSVSVYHYVKNS